MSEQAFLIKRYKAHAGLTDNPYKTFPIPSQNIPAVFRMKDNHTAQSGTTPGNDTWIGGTGIDGATLHVANDNFTQRNDVIFFNGKIWTWFNNNIWVYDPQSESPLIDTFSTWSVAFSPTTISSPHLGLYGVVISGQAQLATCAFESTILARMITYNPWTDTYDNSDTDAYGGGVLAEGVHTEIEFNNKIWWINSGGSDVNVFDPERKSINIISLPPTTTFPMDLNPFEGKMYCLVNTDTSGSLILNIDEVTGANVAVALPGTDGSGNSILSYQSDYIRSSLFTTTVSGHFTGTNPADRWPVGDAGDGVKTPHMVAQFPGAISASGGLPGIATYVIMNDGTRFQHTLAAVPARFSIHSFPVGSFFNSPFQQGDGNTHQAITDDMSAKSTVVNGDEVVYINYRAFDNDTAGARTILFPHSKDGSYRHNFNYNGPKTNDDFIDTFASGSTPATSFPKLYAGGHRFHYPDQIDIIVSGIEQGGDFGLENDNMRFHFRVVTNADTPNGTPVSCRIFYAEYNGAAMKGTGIIENPSHGTVYDTTRLDIPSVDSGTIYSFEWNNKAHHFIDTEWTQVGIFCGTSGTMP